MPRHVQTGRNRDGGQGRTWRRATPTLLWTKYGEGGASQRATHVTGDRCMPTSALANGVTQRRLLSTRLATEAAN